MVRWQGGGSASLSVHAHVSVCPWVSRSPPGHSDSITTPGVLDGLSEVILAEIPASAKPLDGRCLNHPHPRLSIVGA